MNTTRKSGNWLSLDIDCGLACFIAFHESTGDIVRYNFTIDRLARFMRLLQNVNSYTYINELTGWQATQLRHM